MMASRNTMTLALLAGGAGLIGANLVFGAPLSRAAAVPVHFASHQLCSATFVAGLDPQTYFEQAIKPKQGPLAALMRHEIDTERREVRVSLAGALYSRAVHDGAFGCRVLRPGQDIRFDQSQLHNEGDNSRAQAFPTEPVAADDAALTRAIDQAFEENPTGPRRFTQAVVVLHRGNIVGERYAEGVTPSTPLIGWSMTKAVTNALLGVMVREGKLDMHAPAPVPEWRALNDPRAAITPDQLLRMLSGLSCGDSLQTSGFATIFDPDTQMAFDVGDQAAFAAGRPLRSQPGEEWRYTNCNYILLSRIIRDLAGGDADAVRNFIEQELFAPLGMRNSIFEYDIAGVPLGTIHLWASARDWAQFGRLYLHDGLSESGERILPEGWVEYSAELTPQSADRFGFGAGFWTQRGDSAAARARIEGGLPADSFMAVGSQGQYTIVIPSRDLVIVKVGWAYTPQDDREAFERLVRDVIAALPQRR